MNLEQAKALTPCYWECFDIKGFGFKPTPEQALQIINILSTKCRMYISREIRQHLFNRLMDQIFNDINDLDTEDREIESVRIDLVFELIEHRFQTIQCLSDYLANLELKLQLEVNNLNDVAITCLQEKGLLTASGYERLANEYERTDSEGYLLRD